MSRFAAQATRLLTTNALAAPATNLHNLNPLPRFQIINCTPHRGHAKAANFRKRGITGNDRRRLIHMGYKVMHQGCCTRAFVNQMAPCLMRRPVGLNPCLAGAAGERGWLNFDSIVRIGAPFVCTT